MSEITQTISELSTPPSRTDPTNFDDRADQFLSELPTLVEQINAWAGEVNAVIVQVSADTPAGAVQAFAMATPPVGWLECDGAEVSRTTYATLYAAIGDTFGSGDGTSTFNLPDLRGEFIRGWDHGKGADVDRSLGTSQDDDLQPHTHMWGVIDFANAETGGASIRHLGRSYTNSGITDEYRTSSAGDTETRPRNVAMMYAIKY